MEIKGKVHCFFEQSGTFKNEFIKLGIPAEDYDIQNNHNETDHVIDLFSEIEKAYGGKDSIFDSINTDDLIIAFFPCIYFCDQSRMAFRYSYINYRNLGTHEKTEKIIERINNRAKFYILLMKLVSVAIERKLRLIIENPYNGEQYLKTTFVQQPTIVDNDRTLRGDFYKKPTGYWFFNCDRTFGNTIQKNKKIKKIKYADTRFQNKAGFCSEERSLISSDYARNFICDFLIGRQQVNSLMSLF